MKRVLGSIRRVDEKYHLIEDGDRIAVSGHVVAEGFEDTALVIEWNDGEAFDAAKAPFNEAVVSANEAAGDAAAHLDNALAFLDAAFGEGQEEVLFVSKLSVDPVLMRFVAGHAGPSFAEHAKQLMFHERGLDLLEQVDAL